MVPIEEKIIDLRLSWFGHVQRSHSHAVERYIMLFCHCIKRGHGRPKRTWTETIIKDTEKLELSIDMIYIR